MNKTCADSKALLESPATVTGMAVEQIAQPDRQVCNFGVWKPGAPKDLAESCNPWLAIRVGPPLMRLIWQPAKLGSLSE